MQPPPPRATSAGECHHLRADRKPAPQRGAGDHRPGAGQTKDPVHGHPERAIVKLARPSRGHLGEEDRAELVNTLTRNRGDRYHRRFGESGPGKIIADFLGGELDQLAVDGIDLRQRHRPSAYAHEPDHLEMLAGLGHDALVGRHNQQRQVDA